MTLKILILSRGKQSKRVRKNRASEGEKSQTSRCSTNNNLVIKHPNHNSDTYFKSISHPLLMTYGIIFWGNSPHAIDIFRIQKRVIRITTKSGSKASCRQLFKQLEILPLHSQYILSTVLYVIKNKNLYTTNQNIHQINTRYNSNLHLPTCNLTLYQKGAYFSGIKLFNHLPQTLKRLSNDIKAFKPALVRFLKLHSSTRSKSTFN